jgi:hypothetical protein
VISELDWGPVTPELASADIEVAVHVINHALEQPADLARNIRFLRARIAHFRLHLPAGWVQWVIFDDRGQAVSPASKQALSSALEAAQSVRFKSDDPR